MATHNQGPQFLKSAKSMPAFLLEIIRKREEKKRSEKKADSWLERWLAMHATRDAAAQANPPNQRNEGS